MRQSVGRQQPAVEQDHHPVGNLLDLREHVRGDQHGLPAGKFADEVANGDDLSGVEPAGRLVEHQQLRLIQQRLGDRDALPIAAR